MVGRSQWWSRAPRPTVRNGETAGGAAVRAAVLELCVEGPPAPSTPRLRPRRVIPNGERIAMEALLGVHSRRGSAGGVEALPKQLRRRSRPCRRPAEAVHLSFSARSLLLTSRG